MARRGLLYSRVAFLWAWVFLFVGCIFWLFPDHVGETLTKWAHILGLSGAIRTPAGNLWHVLALSLMATITACAFLSSKNPTRSETYYVLLIAKAVSTIGFAGLALTQASAWIVCVVGDGFVGLTLWVSHRLSQSPFYEIWFGKLNISPGIAFWFRYTRLGRKEEEADTWAILFDKGSVEAGKESMSVNSRLERGDAIGQAGPLTWNLSFRDLGRRFEHVPKTLRVLGLAKSVLSSCYLDLRFSGIIQFKDKVLNVHEAPGMIGHIHGKRYAHEWAWVHCNAFEEVEGVVFEGLSARIRVGRWISPPLSSFVFYVDNDCYTFSSIWKLLAAQSDFGAGKWIFKTGRQGVTLEGEAIVAQPENVAIIQYTDTDGSPLWCHNSKLAQLRLRLVDKKKAIDRTFVARQTAAFEIVNRKPPTGDVML